MNRWAGIVVIVFLVTTFAGCASTKITADFVDPAYETISFRKVIVSAPFKDVASQLVAEQVFVKRLKRFGINAVTNLSVFPPTRKTEENQRLKQMREQNIDCLLTVKLLDYYEDEYYVQPSTTTTSTCSCGIASTASSSAPIAWA